MSEKVLLKAGRRNGRTFDNEREFLNAMDAGQEVIVEVSRGAGAERYSIYFETSRDGDTVIYKALTAKPQGL